MTLNIEMPADKRKGKNIYTEGGIMDPLEGQNVRRGRGRTVPVRGGLLKDSSSLNEGCSRATVFNNEEEEVRGGGDVEHTSEPIHEGEKVRVDGDVEHDIVAEDDDEEEEVRVGVADEGNEEERVEFVASDERTMKVNTLCMKRNQRHFLM